MKMNRHAGRTIVICFAITPAIIMSVALARRLSPPSPEPKVEIVEKTVYVEVPVEKIVEGRTEGRREGRREGRKEGAKELLDLLSRGKTIDEARMLLGIE